MVSHSIKSSSVNRVYFPDGDLNEWLFLFAWQEAGCRAGFYGVDEERINALTKGISVRFGQYVKHKLKTKCYIRYADDFVLLSDDKDWLGCRISSIEKFLWQVLLLKLHPDKVYIKTFASGVDWLGWVHFSDHRVLRNVTIKRMCRRLRESSKYETVQSYLGLLGHGNTEKLQAAISGYK